MNPLVLLAMVFLLVGLILRLCCMALISLMQLAWTGVVLLAVHLARLGLRRPRQGIAIPGMNVAR